MYPWRKVAIFSPCLASFAIRPKDGRPTSRTTLAVWDSNWEGHGAQSDGKPPFLSGLSVADTENRRTELQADSFGGAVETRKRHTAQKAVK